MYNILLALLFKTGIKSENHNASIILLNLLFGERDLYNKISNAKKERIDKQYYVSSEKDNITQEIAKEMLRDAEDFVLKTSVLVRKLNLDKTRELRNEFKHLIGLG